MKSTGISPMQVAAGVAAEGGVLLVRDSSNSYYELNLEGLNSMMMPGEWLWTTDVVDARNASFTRTIPLAIAAITVYTDTITVPAGEVWIISEIHIVRPVVDATGAAALNFTWPGMSTLTPGFFAAGAVLGPGAALAADTEIINVADGTSRVLAAVLSTTIVAARRCSLGTDLRLVGPLVLTFLTTTNAVAFTTGAGYIFTVSLHGRKVNKVTA